MPVPGLLNFRRIRRHTVQPPKAAQEARDFQSCEVQFARRERFFLRVKVPDAPDSGKHVANRARVSAVRRNLKEA